MEIQLGKPVVTSDGKRVGSVDQIVLEPDSHEIIEIVVHRGFLLRDDRIVEREHIAAVRSDGTVVLRLSSSEVERLPRFIETEYIVPPPGEVQSVPFPVAGAVNAGGLTTSPVLWRTNPDGVGYQHTARAFFEAAALEPAAVVRTTSLPAEAVPLSKGTDVVGSDGHWIGTVAEVYVDEDGRLDRLVAVAGLQREIRVVITGDKVDGITPEHVRLTVPAAVVLSGAATTTA